MLDEQAFTDRQLPSVAAEVSRPDDPFRFDRVHPLAVGIREAKQVLSTILADVTNIEILKQALQNEFLIDPPGFLRLYEPLLKRYEDASRTADDGRRAIRITVSGADETIIEEKE